MRRERCLATRTHDGFIIPMLPVRIGPNRIVNHIMPNRHTETNRPPCETSTGTTTCTVHCFTHSVTTRPPFLTHTSPCVPAPLPIHIKRPLPLLLPAH